MQVGEITEWMRHVDDMLSLARSFGNPHIVQTLEQARHTLIRHMTGAQQFDPVVAAAAREVRLRQEEETLAARARCTAARAARCLATDPHEKGARAPRSDGSACGSGCGAWRRAAVQPAGAPPARASMQILGARTRKRRWQSARPEPWGAHAPGSRWVPRVGG